MCIFFLCAEFSKLIKEMWTNNVHSVTPMELKRSFSAKHRMYSDYNQQDAQEFLRFFLDSLHCALNTGVKGELLKVDENLRCVCVSVLVSLNLWFSFYKKKCGGILILQ